MGEGGHEGTQSTAPHLGGHSKDTLPARPGGVAEHAGQVAFLVVGCRRAPGLKGALKDGPPTHTPAAPPAPMALTVAALVAPDQAILGAGGLGAADTAGGLLAWDGSCRGKGVTGRLGWGGGPGQPFSPHFPPAGRGSPFGVGRAAPTRVNVLPQDQELGIVLELHQAHLPEGVHLRGGGGRWVRSAGSGRASDQAPSPQGRRGGG